LQRDKVKQDKAIGALSDNNVGFFRKEIWKMYDHMTIIRGSILAVTLGSIFAIVLVTMLKVIERAGFFHRKTAVLVAVSLSILFLVALSQFLVGPWDAYHTAGSDSGINGVARYFLLPGVALGVAAAVLLSQVLLLASKTLPEERPELFAKKPDHSVVKSNSPGRPKKEKAAEKGSKEVGKAGRGVAAPSEALS
jgi:uncharacterized membrane protein YozB (DUF420 family)